MIYIIYAVIPAALVIFLKREREGIWPTLWSGAAGLALGICLAVAIGSLTAGTFAVDVGGLIVSAIAMVITAVVVNRDMFTRRPPGDMRG